VDVDARGRALDELAGRRFDVLVLGGGITGAGVAWEAARLGLSVALVDRGDFGSATSSASSKLIHGGLRYLRLGDVRLVREAHRERRALSRVVAPHLVRRLPFLVPLYRDGPYRPATMQAALWLYSTLAHDRPAGLIQAERARQRAPGLRVEGLRGCGVYSDSWTHDGRLCLAAVRAASEAGATVLNYAEAAELRIAGGRVAGAEVRDLLGERSVSVRAATVVNATGPWVDQVRRLEDPQAGPSSRLSKGAHVLLRPERPWSSALTILHDKVRVTFVVPWEGMLLVGTTDELYEGDPGQVEATDEDVRRLFDEASAAVSDETLRPEAVRFRFAGLRVLPGLHGPTVNARRETVFLRGPAGMLSVAGGKLTTFRHIALGALRELQADLGVHRLDPEPAPLPGAADLGQATGRLAHSYPDLSPATRSHLAHLYGSLAGDLLEEARDEPDLLEPLHPDGPDIAAQVVYARRCEWACRPDDILRRRTTLAVRGLATPEVVERIGHLLGTGSYSEETRK
jgi:glycerol-3-phosphate dehydrogenase